MTIKDNIIMRQVAGTWVVVAVGAASVDFGGMLTLNESGAYLWNKIKEGATQDQLVDAMLEEYEVDRPQAEADVKEFLETIRNAGCLDE